MPNACFGNISSRQRRPRPTRLAACLVTALGLGGLVTPAIAANIVVKACSDADIVHPPLFLFGLRSSVASANDGDTIDMTELSNCTITLTDGAIPITVNNLEFVGPNSHTLTIDGNHRDRVFKHTGSGTLALNGFTVADGYFLYSGSAEGGCIESLGTVQLDNMTVENCYANSLNSHGGGVFSLGVTRLSNSLITGNTATNYGGLAPSGGGIYAIGGFESINSVISNNRVAVKSTGGETRAGSGAAVFVDEGNVYLRGTTVSGNTGSSGGVVNIGQAGNPGGFAIIVESTISSNTGLYALSIAADPPITIANSTIFSNSTQTGVSILNLAASAYPYMWSNIVAENGRGVVSSSNVHGANNFVTGGTYGAPVFPGDTLSSGCLWLGPLRNNGGLTPTHALMSQSIALDKGDTEVGGQPLDQRGLPRVSGAAADIGAYEVQKNDIIFNTGFEGCL